MKEHRSAAADVKFFVSRHRFKDFQETGIHAQMTFINKVSKMHFYSIFEYTNITPSIDSWHFIARGISFIRLFRKIKLWEPWKPHSV